MKLLLTRVKHILSQSAAHVSWNLLIQWLRGSAKDVC